MKSGFLKIVFFLVLSIPFIAFPNWKAEEIPLGVVCDDDSDCFLLPKGPLAGTVSALVYLSCTGAKPSDIDSVKAVADSLGWVVATCGKTRNHRDSRLNENDILSTLNKVISTGKADPNKIVIYGFSGQGAQALGLAFRYPDKVAGTITECAHLGGITKFDTYASRNQIFYIVTKDRDWNREQNEALNNALLDAGIKDTLIVHSGEHGIGPASGVFDACKWFDNKFHTAP